MKAQRLKEFAGYGYKTIGETENGETLIAKRFDTGVVLVMAVNEQYTSQIRFTKEQFEELKDIEATENA